MRTQKLIITALVISLTTLAVVFFKESKPSKKASDLVNTRLLAEDFEINLISQIKIKDASKQVTLKKNEAGSWGIEEANSYPANAEKIFELITDLQNEKIASFVGRGFEDFGEYDLDQNSEEWKGKSLMVYAGDSLVLKLLIGSNRYGGESTQTGGAFVAVGDSDIIYLLQSDLNPAVESEDWARLKLFNLAPEKISSFSVENNDFKFRLDRNESTKQFVFKDGNANQNTVNKILGEFAPFEVLSFIKNSDVEKAKLKKSSSVTIKLAGKGDLDLTFYSTDQEIAKKDSDDKLVKIVFRDSPEFFESSFQDNYFIFKNWRFKNIFVKETDLLK